MGFLVLLRGGGDLASGIAIRLWRAQIPLVITELPQPMAVRRLVSFCQAVYDGKTTVEEVHAQRVKDAMEALGCLDKGVLPVLVDPDGISRFQLKPEVIVDCRMTKQPPELKLGDAPFIIGIGPGFSAGENCHAVVESKRGHYLGRVIWKGKSEEDTGQPEAVANHQSDRVLRAPADGILKNHSIIGNFIEKDEVVTEVNGLPIRAAFSGYIRGLLHDGIPVTKGLKVGDVDPRMDPVSYRLVSDKALSIGGGVLEALLTRPDIRQMIWCK